VVTGLVTVGQWLEMHAAQHNFQAYKTGLQINRVNVTINTIDD